MKHLLAFSLLAAANLASTQAFACDDAGASSQVLSSIKLLSADYGYTSFKDVKVLSIRSTLGGQPSNLERTETFTFVADFPGQPNVALIGHLMLDPACKPLQLAVAQGVNIQ